MLLTKKAGEVQKRLHLLRFGSQRTCFAIERFSQSQRQRTQRLNCAVVTIKLQKIQRGFKEDLFVNLKKHQNMLRYG